METKISEKSKILFVIFVSLGIYYPAIFGAECSVDDSKMITSLMNMSSINWKALFLPHSSILYYRPVLYLTFILDRFIWLCDASFMHLENVLFHTLNAVLVYYLVKVLLKTFAIDAEGYHPMFSALLFAAHPINTEAVDWISGRTDLMAGTFVFLSLLTFLISLRKYGWCWISALFYLLALLSKEVSVALLPVIALFLLLNERPIPEVVKGRRLKLLLPYLLSLVIYFLMRFLASGFSDSGMSIQIRTVREGNLLKKTGSAIKALGFYVKKLFVPLPLNFGIIEINGTFYLCFGIIVLISIIYLLIRKRNISSFPILLSVLFILPAIPVAISKMAWTPLGERYLYISSFGVSVFVILTLNRLTFTVLRYGIVGVLIFAAGFVTVGRNRIWQSDLALFKDTVEKSPTFAAARNEYGMALAKAGMMDEAIEQFRIGQRLGHGIYQLPEMNIIEQTSVEKGSLSDAKARYAKLLKHVDSREYKDLILTRIVTLTEAQIMKEKNPKRFNKLIREDMDYIERLNNIHRSGYYSYRLGQLYLQQGNKKKAQANFAAAVVISPNEFFAPAAKKLAQRLEKEIGH